MWKKIRFHIVNYSVFYPSCHFFSMAFIISCALESNGKERRKCHIDVPGEAVTIQCLNMLINVPQGAWDYTERAVQKVKEDVLVKVMFQSAAKC